MKRRPSFDSASFRSSTERVLAIAEALGDVSIIPMDGNEPFIAALLEWLRARRDPRWNEQTMQLKQCNQACADFCEWVAGEEPQ
jgi:hypothetical protein